MWARAAAGSPLALNAMPSLKMIAGVTGVEGDGAPGMRNGLVEAPELGQGNREIEVSVGVVRAGLGRRLEFLCRGRIRLLRQQCQTEPEMCQRRTRLERQRPPEAPGRVLMSTRLEIGVAQIAVIGDDTAIYRDRLAIEINRPEMISFQARDHPQQVKRRVVTGRERPRALHQRLRLIEPASLAQRGGLGDERACTARNAAGLAGQRAAVVAVHSAQLRRSPLCRSAAGNPSQGYPQRRRLSAILVRRE